MEKNKRFALVGITNESIHKKAFQMEGGETETEQLGMNR